MHRGTLREWGFGGMFRFTPKAAGRGPSVSLMPAWGDTASGVQQLWEHGATDPLLHSAPGARLAVELGYGFVALRGQGLLTPYGGVSLVEFHSEIVWDLSGDREDAYKLGNARFSKGELLNHFESRRELTDAIKAAIEQSGMDGCPRCAKMLED